MGNIALAFRSTARAAANKTAIHYPDARDGRYRSATFARIESDSDKIAAQCAAIGIDENSDALLALKPGYNFIVGAIALFKVGARPTLIDPGIGLSNALGAIERIEPDALVGEAKIFLIKKFFRSSFESIEKAIINGPRFLAGPRARTIEEIFARPDGARPFPIARKRDDEIAATLFTTGATGPPKGVIYTHRMFNAQLDLIGSAYGLTREDVDMPIFPLFALFSIALGMTVVIPDIDSTRPARAPVDELADLIDRYKVTFSFGSPAAWGKIAARLAARRRRLPSLRKVLMAGAPVDWSIHENLLDKVMGEGSITHTPFGSTEALPAADITGAELLAIDSQARRADGEGVCVGRPLGATRAMIIEIDSAPIATMREASIIEDGAVGEIIFSGDIVSPAYNKMPKETRASKILDDTGRLWHRSGDVGRIDRDGRIWFLGRLAHRVETKSRRYFSVEIEGIFNQSALIARSALVGIGADRLDQTPLIAIEPKRRAYSRAARVKIATEARMFGRANTKSSDITKFIIHNRKFPTDIRHNAKIFREKITRWAENNRRAIITVDD